MLLSTVEKFEVNAIVFRRFKLEVQIISISFYRQKLKERLKIPQKIIIGFQVLIYLHISTMFTVKFDRVRLTLPPNKVY